MRKYSDSFSLIFAAILFMAIAIGLNQVDVQVATAQEIGFLEDFVLAKDREKVLKQLVPGTEKYYYFHALHYQNNQQLEKVDDLLTPWIKRFGITQKVDQIRNRQSLLKYSDDPEETLAYLTRQLGLYFEHERAIPDTQRELPTKLDEDRISTEALLAKALRQKSSTQNILDKGLYLLAEQELTKNQRRHLLQRLRRPDFPNLIDLLVADLKERDSSGFGSLAIHRALTLKQLDELAEKHSKTKSSNNFANVYLAKLRPSEDIDWRADPVETRKYLDRLWSFVDTLNPNYNSLKAAVLYRQLELDLRENKFNRERFMAYLKLPRNVAYVNPDMIKNVRSRSHVVNLGANYQSMTMLRPIGNDEPLIRDYLHHFLLESDDYSEFEPFVREPYLKRQFAIVKILNGVGDVEKWASMLTPEQYKNILDRIDVEFLSTNPEFFAVEDDVKLELNLKNVDNLIVKVFEINTANYYRKHGKEIDTDITLDGLVPNFEENFKYDQPPAIRTKRQFKFPQIKNRGVYVVDFIAGGKSSRALIRKGRLQMFGKVTPVGQQFTIIDQSGDVVTDANLWIGGSRYNPMKDGRILVPFSTQPGRVPAIISQGEFSSLQMFDHIAEKYQFKASIVLDRENLTRSNTARALIRPSLQIVGGNPVPVAMLEKGKLIVTSVNLDGISATKVIDGLEFSEKDETICEFVVPPRLKTVTLALTAEFKNASYNKRETASANQSYAINSIDKSEQIQDVHLLPTNQGFYLELLGKTGEVRKKQGVRVTVNPDMFKTKVSFELQTDEKGLVELGKLENVKTISVVTAGGSTKTFPINTQDQTYYRTIDANEGEVVELPAPAGIVEADRKYISMFEVRGGSFVNDVFDLITVEEGLVKISGLKQGDYDLRLNYEAETNGVVSRGIKVRITKGPQTDNVLVGKHRYLEVRGNKALHVARVSTDKKKIRIQLENTDEFTRLHVIANRYQPAFNAYNAFATVGDLEPWMRKPSLRRSVYMEGRKIGDEYEYILRRKYAQKYPGNMLERPSLLLNPWEVQSTSNNSQDAAEGNKFGRVGNDKDKKSNRGRSNRAQNSGNSDFANLDYLGEDAVLLANLKPTKTGIVTIDRSKLGPNQHVRIIALNAFQTIQRTVNLPLKKLKPRDSRLANALDPSEHFSQTKQIDILKKGEVLSIDDVVSAKFQQYDDLADVFQLYLALNSSTHLGKFKFILDWENKSEKEKRTLYSKYACHELNFFLYNKDSSFFDKIVAPHLENKRDKTFLDLWLLEKEVSQFARPWKFARLNTLEKILLSQRLEEQSGDIVRNINELYSVTPTTRSQFDSLYDTSINGLGLDDQIALGRALRDDRKKNLPKLAERNMSKNGKAKPEPRSGFGGGQGVGGGMIVGGMTIEGVDLSADLDALSDDYGSDAPAFAADTDEETENESLMFKEDLQRGFSAGESINGRYSMERLSKAKDASKFEYFGENKPQKAPVLGGRIENRTRQVPVTRMTTQTKTRSVPVQRMRTETKTRNLPDGTIETYTVQVPYTENITQSYSVQVPVQEMVTEKYQVVVPEESSESNSFFSMVENQKLLEQQRSLYRRLGPTKEWMENNYYLLRPEQQTSDLVRVNRFWRDYSNHDGGTFLSQYFSESHRTFTEMMFALSVLDLPLKAPEQKFDYADNSMKMTAGGPSIAFHQQVRSAIFDRGNTTILVSENFFQKNDRFRYEDGVRFDKFVSGDFLAHTLYGAQVVLTNPTSTPRAVELLIQIPLGSVPCAGAQETRTIQMDLAAFSTKTFDYAFYFPTAGDFEHYPAHVSADEKVLAVADATTFKVVDRPAKVDQKSWEFVSQNGSDDEVIEFINQENVLRLDLEKIAFRMKEKAFFKRAIETLRNRYVYNNTLWAYAVKHDDAPALREFLTHAPQIVSKCGISFKCDLLTIDPVERNWYQHKEYWPLVNDRAHQLGPQRKILNPNFYAQYNRLLSVLANHRELSDDDHLVISYYMLLQDRIETALEHFDSVSKDDLPCEIQYDYCDAYLDLYREKPNDAQAKAAIWADYPVDHWRNRFKQILAQVDEIKGGETSTVDEKDNSQRQTELASKSESFDFEIKSGVATIKYQNLDEVKVNYYEMDIELLFSRSPFAQDELDGFSMIRPNVSQTVKMKRKKKDKGVKGTHEFELSDEMKNKNVLVEIVAGDQAKSQPYFAHSLDAQVIEKFGQVHVTDQDSSKAISKTYVKVYARMYDGSVRFHKDGYTDLRGRFDYVSQSNRSIDGIEKFSILILSDEKGAVIRQANRPQE